MEVSDQPYVLAILPLGEGAPITLAGPHSRSGHLEKGRNCCSCWQSIHGPSVVQPVPYPLFRQYMTGAARKESGRVPAASSIQLSAHWLPFYHFKRIPYEKANSFVMYVCPTTATPIRPDSVYFLFRKWLKCVHKCLVIPAMTSFLSFSNK
jgi:hypothetical protein